MYEIYNRLPQTLPIIIEEQLTLLKSGESLKIKELNFQIKNLHKRNFLKIKELKK